MENQPAIYECDICRKHFYRGDNYNNHKIAHDNGFDYDACNKPHDCLDDLIIHIERAHAPEIGYTCDICQKKFPRLIGLLTHIETKHNPTHTNTAGKLNNLYKEISCYICILDRFTKNTY